MTFSGLRQVAWQATKRLLVGLLMAGVAVLALGGSRWVVASHMFPVYFFVDLYGTVALLWLAAVGHRVSRRIDGTAHSAEFGTTLGIFLFDYWGGPPTRWDVLLFLATLLPAVSSKSSARRVALVSFSALLLYTIATWHRYETSGGAGGLPWALFGAVPFFFYAAILNSRGVNERSEWPRKLTIALIVLAALEFIGIPTSFHLFLDFGLRHTWFHN